ncbi:MAG: N-acetylglucosaminyltransferase [Rivularia sp. (in: cyanobacteria)]
MIQTHTNPEQIYRLIKTIQTSGTDNQVIISHDFSSCNLNTNSLEKNNVKVLHGKGGRGDFSSVRSYLNAITWLVENQIEYDWLIYLSGQDYPIKPIVEIEYFLSKTDYDGFMEYFNVFSFLSHWSIQEGQSRYLFKYQSSDFLKKVPIWLKQLLTPIKIINYLQPFFRINLAYEMFGVRRKSLFNEDFLCYGGSFFTSLSKKCVEHLHNFSQKHPEVVEYYQEV